MIKSAFIIFKGDLKYHIFSTLFAFVVSLLMTYVFSTGVDKDSPLIILSFLLFFSTCTMWFSTLVKYCIAARDY